MKDGCTEEEYLKPSVFKNRGFYEIEQRRQEAEKERRINVLYAFLYSVTITGAIAMFSQPIVTFLAWLASVSIVVIGIWLFGIGVVGLLIMQFKYSKQ